MASKETEMGDVKKKKGNLEKSYFDVLGLCCSSEVPLIEKILKSLHGVIEVSVIVPSRTVIVVHDTLLISQLDIVKALNKARLEANVRVKGKEEYKGKWPSTYVILSGLLLGLSFLKYVYHPLQWLAIVAVAVGIWPITLRCIVAIRNFTLDANILMFTAVVGTIVMRDYTEAGTIVFLFTVSEWLGMRASHKATAVMSSLMNMAPQKATIAETGEILNVEDVKLNTILGVKTGEIIPIDGIVVEGTCEVDEKNLTGESYPVSKQKDSIVHAGTVNVNGYVSVKTTALAEDCAVAKMARLVEEAQNKKSNAQMMIDRFAKYYTPAVVLISAGLAAIPAILKLHNMRHWFYLALVVLVSACPCGLILSTPVATFCALSKAATAGLLIKGGDYLEILAKLKFIAFDKTGTLTKGEFTVEDFKSLVDDVSFNTLLYWLSSIESKSSHPIAQVLVDYASSKSIEPNPEKVQEFQDFPGEGVSAKIDGKHIFIGNKKFGQRANFLPHSNIGGDTKEGRTSGYIYCEGVLIGTFSLSDNCRSGAKDALKELKSLGIKTALLTGDCHSAAMHAQEQLGHGLDIVHSELLPEDKAKIIQGYKKVGITAMVGDGVNDAPALVTADIGISMGVSGTALANETSHVVLMSNDVRKIAKAIKLARRTRWKVMENIVFSIATKAGVLAYAIAGHPLVWLAVVADVVTCLIVILNSMLLLRGSHGHGHGQGQKCHSHKSKCSSSNQHKHSLKMNQKCCSVSSSDDPCQTSHHQHSDAHDHDKHCSSTHDHDHSHEKHCSSNHDHHHDHDHDHSHDKHCSSTTHASPECASECQPHPHTPSTCEGNAFGASEACNTTCCEDDHCLEMLGSKGCCSDDTCTASAQHETTSGCVQEHNLKDPHTSIVSEHSEHHVTINNHLHHHEPKIICCEDEVTSRDEMSKSSSLISRCHSHGVHGARHHHHHVTCHGEAAIARHVCNSLRKREVGSCCRSYRNKCCGSSHGQFVAGLGGLTEIITE